jgi:hypothetical protein
MTFRTWFFGVVLLAAASVQAGEPLGLRVTPAISFAPANLIVRATVEPNDANRFVEVVAESTDFYRASTVQLDGNKAARTNTFEFRSLPSGAYEVTATLIGNNGKARSYVRQHVNVIASGGGH